MFMKELVDGVRSGPTGMEVIKVHAIARIMLNNWIPNVQASWVKEGSRMSQLLLTAGVNDLGGTLINESISTAAGAQHGQLMRPSEFREIIRQAGKIPAERYTTYQTKRIFNDDDRELDPLDFVGENVEEVFGSYKRLVKLETFRFEHPNRARKSADDDQADSNKAASKQTEAATQRHSIRPQAIHIQPTSGPAAANPR